MNRTKSPIILDSHDRNESRLPDSLLTKNKNCLLLLPRIFCKSLRYCRCVLHVKFSGVVGPPSTYSQGTNYERERDDYVGV